MTDVNALVAERYPYFRGVRDLVHSHLGWRTSEFGSASNRGFRPGLGVQA